MVILIWNVNVCAWTSFQGNWEAVDARTQDKHLHYFINICRAVNPTPELMKCPGGPIGACQIDHSSDKGFNLGYVQSNPQVAASGELSLQYSGGSECHHQFNRSIRIIFSCAKMMVRSGITKTTVKPINIRWYMHI